jgi:hypothetical protein
MVSKPSCAQIQLQRTIDKSLFENGTLVYFDVYMRAEPIRIMLTHAGVKFKDFRIKEAAEFHRMKNAGRFPAGQVPVFITSNG